MTPYVHGNIVVNTWKRSGIVLSSQVRSETHVTTSGGGGYITDGNGYISAPSVHSNITRQQDIWIQKRDGIHECIRLKNCDFQVIAGQRISFILAGKPEADSGYYMVLINHDAAKWWWISEPNDFISWAELIPSPPERKSNCGSFGCMGLMFGILCMYSEYSAYQNVVHQDPTHSYNISGCGITGACFALAAIFVLVLNAVLADAHKRSLANHQNWHNQLLNGLKSHLSKLGAETPFDG